jgi:hypothetical protein
MQPQSTSPPELGGGQNDSQDFNVVWNQTRANKIAPESAVGLPETV